MTQNVASAGIGIKPLVSLRQHPRIAVWAVIITLLAALPMVWIKGESYYEAESVIQIAPRYMKTLKDDNELDFQSNSQYRQFVQQQSTTIQRYDILRDGLRLANQAHLASSPKANQLQLDYAIGGAKTAAKPAPNPVTSIWQRPNESERQAVERLRNLLQVSAVSDTYMVRIGLSGKNKAELAPIINAVVSIYLERVRDEQVFGKDERIAQLQKRQDHLLKQIDEKAERRNTIAGDLGIATFSEEAGNPYDKAIERLREALADAKIKRFTAAANEKAFLAHGDTDPGVRSILESVSVDPGLNSLKASLNNRRATLVSGMAGLTPQHPGYQQNKIELAEIDAEIRQQTEKITTEVRRNLQSRFSTAATQTAQLETDLQRELTEQEKSRGHFATLFKEAQNLSADVTQIRKELDAIQERLNFFAAETSALGFVRLVSAAMTPETPLGVGKTKLLLMAIIAAIAAGLLLPIVYDLMDRRIHTPNDVVNSFGFPPMGWLIHAKDNDSRLFRADQLRRLASALIREQDRTQLRIFGFTALQPQGGTSTTVFDLQQAFAEMGLPAIAVEANAFSRDPRFATAPQHDLADGLPTKLNLNTPQLYLCGNDRHIHAIDRLEETLAYLAQEYRFVLVDLPPLLVSGDAELALRSTPAVIAIVEAEAQSRGEVARAARVLQSIDPASIGVIVNQVRPLDGGGYVNDLMEEFISGQKKQPAGFVIQIASTMKILLKSALHLPRDLQQQIKALLRSKS
ncbi:hypothetical protein [Deefgea salmonis]|uniref:Uncharacterized protein n=1 Tax=Deefgea salmonis TaxID=2875502 RepID=A0ABS8BNN4_9NEIS|nr:hypothetical protein [Deefgea salmonis]MCB5197342.1 hypothetical protein [Deefgea salmonis]